MGSCLSRIGLFLGLALLVLGGAAILMAYDKIGPLSCVPAAIGVLTLMLSGAANSNYKERRNAEPAVPVVVVSQSSGGMGWMRSTFGILIVIAGLLWFFFSFIWPNLP